MKKIEEKRTLLINKHRYQIVWNYQLFDDMYLYMINVKDYSDILFIKMVPSGEVSIVTEPDMLAYLIKEMSGQINRLLF